jgi:hypothetical protein
MEKRRRLQKEFDYCCEKASMLQPPECFKHDNEFSRMFVSRNVWRPIYIKAVMLASSGRTIRVYDLTDDEVKKAKDLSIQYIDEWFIRRKEELERNKEKIVNGAIAKALKPVAVPFMATILNEVRRLKQQRILIESVSDYIDE